MQFGGQPMPWSEVEIESLRLRNVSQILIHEIGAAGPENAEESARRACGVIQRMADQVVSADARIAELELECAQWRLELRIYRETENKRIAELETAMKRQAAAVKMIDMSHVARAETMMQHAQVLHDQSNTAALESERAANTLLTDRIAELEQAVAIRDTEIARLETDLELARRDAERWRKLRAMNWTQKDALAVVHVRDLRLGTLTFTHDRLDLAVDARAGNGGGV